jgi:hypothetical protein
MMLDAEALGLMCTGALAILIPEAFIRTLIPGADVALSWVLVPLVGSLAVGIAVIQHGLTVVRHSESLRALLRGRMVIDVLMTGSALAHMHALSGAALSVVVGGVAVALLFAAVRFNALLQLEEQAELNRMILAAR